MIIVVSPAKSIRNIQIVDKNDYKEPFFYQKSKVIVNFLKKKKPNYFAKTFNLSPKLAELNFNRYMEMGDKNMMNRVGQAIRIFYGDVYKGIDIDTIEPKHFAQIDQKVLILSGLYGVLNAFDTIEPYRLEMGSKIKFNKYDNLYKYWKQSVTKYINEYSKESKSKYLLNLASSEYFKVIDTKTLKLEVIDFDFLEVKNGKTLNISFYSKKARGLMTRFIVTNDIRSVEELKKFNGQGYEYSQEKSSEKKLIYIRNLN